MKNNKHDLIMRGLAFAGLESVFGAEWINLSSEDQDNVALDALDNNSDLREYRENIGIGNLEAYAKCINYPQ